MRDEVPRAMKINVSTVSLITIALALGASPSVDSSPPGGDEWDATAAARYLDARMDDWWANAKVLKTGDGEERCLSCHTAIPYALARAALRRLSNDGTPTAHEQRIAETAKLRVENARRKQPFYDDSEEKKLESRGVESVLNAVILTHLDHNAEPDETLRRAMTRLWEAQRPDGAWDWLDFGLEPYETPDAAFYGATAAALAAGSPAGERASTGPIFQTFAVSS